ncbi:MAG: BtpA family membrane complex biogenesis protein [Phycisphaerae bacterium]|nr:BtpA family membrane complex biogenesis protein [Phycisphaerae bacterium]
MKTAKTESIFGSDRAVIGMVHLRALPGTPAGQDPLQRIAQEAVREARMLVDAGFDAIMLENMHDVPYLKREVGPEIISSMTAIAGEVRRAVDVPMGIQVLAGANTASLAIAHATGCQFIRAEGFVFASIADEGAMLDADAGPLLRYRRSIGAEHVHVLADIRKKHTSHAITSDLGISDWAHAAEFAGADGVIVTGTATGRSVEPSELQAAAGSTSCPVIVGSGATSEDLDLLLQHADAVIVGSSLKIDGHWANPMDQSRVEQFMEAATLARSSRT